MAGAASARELFPELSTFELAAITIIADAIVRLRANWSGDRVAAYMDQRARALLGLQQASRNEWAAVWAAELKQAREQRRRPARSGRRP